MVSKGLENTGNVVIKSNPTTNFTQNILKLTVGAEKAANAFNSISMSQIPNKQDKTISLEGNPKT
jgi:hypothetical protein